MRKSRLTDNTPIFVVKIEQLVTKAQFSLALSDYMYRKRDDQVLVNLTKKDAKSILKKELINFGRRGEYMEGSFEASFELGQERNRLYDLAKAWVEKNYPYL